MKFQERQAVGYQIAYFLLIQVVFSLLWALIYGALVPKFQSFQVGFCPSDCYDPAQATFFNSLIFAFPIAVEFGSVFWLFNHSQRKRGPEDLPG